MRSWLAQLCLLLLLLLWGSPPAAQADGELASAPSIDLSDPGDFDPLFDEPVGELPVGFPDPAEETNRRVQVFNGLVDRWMLDPITRAYGWLFPNPVKRAIRRFFANLGEPATTANNILQLEWQDAGLSGSRFLINSTVGLAGFFDVAQYLGLEYHRSDFGQTLALAGTPSGAYLVIPLLGPNDVRDAFGVLADTAMHPLTWFLGPANFLIYGVYTGSQGLSIREHHLDELNALRESSVDAYAALRSAYYQNRMAQIWSRREDRRDDWKDDLPDPRRAPRPAAGFTSPF
jgi:phospholipid-binding lipoprotein MlaA